MTGHLIAISGPDGSGKSTVIQCLTESLAQAGVPVSRVWIRLGYTPGFSAVKQVLRKAGGRTVPAAGNSPKRQQMMTSGYVRHLWLTLAMLDVAIYGGIYLRLLRLRRVVLCDRYLDDATLDLQQYFPSTAWLWRKVLWPLTCWVSVKPSLNILLAVPGDVLAARRLAKQEPFPDPPHQAQWRDARYEAMAQDPRFLVIPATSGAPAVRDRILAAAANLEPELFTRRDSGQ